ncbi:MAG TPA: amidohydrolase family protein [Acidobacteriota bacterium]|nr:amidohydrolase family protein [Acidobacteriota bacterium]
MKSVGALGVVGAKSQGTDKSLKRPSRKGITSTKPADYAEQIARRVNDTLLVDSHEHLPDESARLSGSYAKHRKIADDWSLILSHYLDDDFISAGMSKEAYDAFYASDLDPLAKWRLIESFWPAVKNTGYGQAVMIALRDLYSISTLSAKTVERVAVSYRESLKPGLYRRVLCELAGLDSCQVNAGSFHESDMPDLLLQDISIVGMHMGPDLDAYGNQTEVKDLADWHSVIDRWFEKYGPYAVAVKSQAAYSRGLDYEDVPAERAAPVFKRLLSKEPVSAEEQKLVQDHLFWYAIMKARDFNLPVKLHTGYYAGNNGMPLNRVAGNPGAVSEIVRRAPDTTFVLMHISWPYYEDLIALAKHYTNVTLDMCWAWILNPATSTEFLEHYLMTAPVNKILTFGGDYSTVEPVLGHAAMCRHGITRALINLVDEGWLTTDSALELVEPIMCGNGRQIFRLEEKKAACRKAPWLAKR